MKLANCGVIAMAALAFPVGTAALAQEADRNIMAADKGSAIWTVADDIARLGQNCGKPLNVVESSGSLENFFGVRNRHNTQIGIVAGDILSYLSSYRGSDQEVKAAVQGMRIMLPLFQTEVHIIAREGVKTLEDLNGLRLGVGPEDGAANFTSQMVLDIAQVKVAERVKGTNQDMIELLLQGEIDALVRVAAAPEPTFSDPRIDHRFHLIPITNELVKAAYKPTTLPGGTYAFQEAEVSTVAVKTVLMTYEFGSEKNAYYRHACETVADFTKLIVDNLSELKRTGHPKWKDVDLTEIPDGWKIGDCARKGLEPSYPLQCTETASTAENQEYLDLLKKHMNE